MKQILIIILFFSINSLHSQVLISNSSGVPDTTAMLEVKSILKGFLPPRMAANQRDEIVNPTPGLIIYCTDCLEMQMFNDTAWTNMIGLPPKEPTIQTITISTQTWMAANLNIGTMIPGATTMTNNGVLEKYCYDDDPTNCAIYGALYEWDEMMQYVTTAGAQGICPTGFHLPTDDEWKTLEIYLGMSEEEADESGTRGTDQGSQLAGNEPLWSDDILDQNAAFGTSGFAGLPGGIRNTFSYEFVTQSTSGYFWSSTEFGDYHSRLRVLTSDTPKVWRMSLNKAYGFSVRCVQD